MKSEALLERSVNNKMGNIKINSGKLTGADGLRAIACLSVIIHHLSQNLCLPLQVKGVQAVQSFTLLGNVGVSVFFVLSGFLLSFPFWKQYLNEGIFPDIKQYALRRAGRIIPGYYTSLLVCSLLVIILHIPGDAFWIRLLAGLTFTAGFHYITFFPNEINGPFWSISFEVFCYFLMPLFMFGLFKITEKKRSFIKSIFYWLGVFALILFINKLVHIFMTPDDINRGWQFGDIGGAKYWMPNYNPIGFFGHFTVGIVAAGITARLFAKSETIDRLKKVYLFDVISVLCFIGSAVLLWKVRGLPEFGFSIQNQPYYFPFYALLIGGTLATAPLSNLFGKLLDNRFFKYTAKVSFGLYIWHYLIIFIIKTFWVKDFVYFGIKDIKAWGMLSLVVLLTSYIIASLSFKFIEKPALDWAHRVSGGR